MEFFIFQLVNFKMSTILIKIDLFLLLLPLLTAEILIDERRGLILEKCSAGHVYDQMGYFTMAFRMLAPDSNIGKPVVPKECATTKIPEWPDESFSPNWYTTFLDDILRNSSKRIETKYATLDFFLNEH